MGRQGLGGDRRAWVLAVPLALAAAALCPLAGAAPGDILTEITLQLQPAARKERAVRAEALQGVLQRRLPILSSEPGTVTLEANGRVRVRVQATAVIPEARLAWLTHPGVLEVVALPDVQTGARPNARYMASTYADTMNGGMKVKFLDQQRHSFIEPERVLSKAPRIVTGADLAPGGASVLSGGQYPLIRLKFGPGGTRRLAEFGRSHAGEAIAILLDGNILVGPLPVPPREKQIGTDGKTSYRPSPLEQGDLVFSGMFRTSADAGDLATVLNSGPLPVPVKVLDQKVITEEAPGPQ